MKKLAMIFSALVLTVLTVSCTKSGALAGGGGTGSSSFGSSVNGSVTGGLSAVSGATINLMVAGSSTTLGTATTASDGSFNLVFTNPGGNSLLYLQVTGGNAGGGTNSNSQFVTIVGTTGSFQPTQRVNEMTTAAVQLTGFNMGRILTDANGTVTLGAPGNAVSANNVVAQFQNLISTSSGALNTSNLNLSSATQTGLSAIADAFASCIEVPAKCSILFNTAQSSGLAASNLLEVGYNALINNAIASPLYTLAFPMNSNTGFSLTSSSVPGGFTFNNLLAITVNTFSTGQSNARGVAIDGSGNLWVVDQTNNVVVKMNPSGAILGTFSTGPTSGSVAIDLSGNVWIPTNNALIELNSSGTSLGSFAFSIFSNVQKGISIDQSGNIWVDDAGSVQKFNSSGTSLGTFSTGVTQTSGQTSLAIDASGNVWGGTFVNNSLPGQLSELNSSGTVIATFNSDVSLGSVPIDIAFDPSGNPWIANSNGHFIKMTSGGVILLQNPGGAFNLNGIAFDTFGNVWCTRSVSRVSDVSSSGTLLATYTSASGLSGTFQGIAIDGAGNVWVSTGGTVQELVQVAMGTEFFPYSGQTFPRGY